MAQPAMIGQAYESFGMKAAPNVVGVVPLAKEAQAGHSAFYSKDYKELFFRADRMSGKFSLHSRGKRDIKFI
jgi:hypothetical protein